MLIIGRFSVFVLSLFLAVSTTAAFAQVDVERLAKRLEKLEAENDALKQRLRRLERVESPVKVSRVEAPAMAAPVVAPPLKQVSLEGKPFEGVYGLVFGSLVSGNMELATFQPSDQNTFMYNDPYSYDRAFVNYGFPNRRMNSKGFGLAVGYNIPISDKFLFGFEARASLPRWSYTNRGEMVNNIQYPHFSSSGSCSFSPCLPYIPTELQSGFRDLRQDRFKLGADADLSFRPGLMLSDTFVFGRFGVGLQHAEQAYTHTSIVETCTSPQYDIKNDPYSYSVTLVSCSASRKDATTFFDKVTMNFPYLVFGLGVEHDLGPVFLRVEAEGRNYFKSDGSRTRMAPGLGQRINAGVGVRF